MKKRLPTSIVIFIVSLGFVLLRQFSLWLFDAFACVIMFGACFEIIRIHKNNSKPIDCGVLLLTPVLQCLIFAFASGKLVILLELAFVILIVLYLLTFEIILYGKNRKENQEKPQEEINAHLFDRTKNTLQVFGYPILPLVFMFVLNHSGYQVGYVGIALIFAVSMMTDTFAYLVGSAWGKRRFIPEVSPKKSIAGIFGGFFGGIVGAGLVFVFFYFTNWFNILNTISLTKALIAFGIIGLIGSFADQLGDLVASAYKRKVGIKDFSNIFPGHGGFMDRVDGMMFTSIVVYLVLALFFV